MTQHHFSASFLRAFANLFSHVFKVLMSFGAHDPKATGPPPPPSKTAVIASTHFEMVIERAVSIDIILKYWS